MRADFRIKKAILRRERADFRPKNAELKSERAYLKPERAGLRPEPVAQGQYVVSDSRCPTDKHMDEHTDEHMDKQKSPCVLQDFVSFGAAAQKANFRPEGPDFGLIGLSA